MSKIEVSIILPTYNESGNIIKLIETIREQLQAKKISNEVIVIDDDSPDKTGLLAQKYFSTTPDVRVIVRKNDRGLASAIRKGIESAVGDIVVVMDTDFNHDPEVVPKLVEKCHQFDLVIGSRFIKGGGMANKTREILSYLFNILVRIILGSPVHDNLSGFFAMKRKKLELLDFDKIFWGYGDYFIRLIYLAKLQANTFAEVPSFYKDREYGASKSQFLNMFKEYLSATLDLRFKKS